MSSSNLVEGDTVTVSTSQRLLWISALSPTAMSTVNRENGVLAQFHSAFDDDPTMYALMGGLPAVSSLPGVTPVTGA